jgi:asparagine synthase (glutamine-hydrolysing)
MARKRGFTVPVGDWIARRSAQLGALVARQPGLREICLPQAVEALFRDPKGRHGRFAAWTLLFYALWHRQHIERLPAGPDVFATLGG